MIPPPPRSTLFPYTTLFRSELAQQLQALGHPGEILIRQRHLLEPARVAPPCEIVIDRKSTRLNSSHANISYAVFCLKKKKEKKKNEIKMQKNIVINIENNKR